MIAPQTFANYPTFGSAATKCCPIQAKYDAGYIPGDVLPAEHLNWFLAGATGGVTALNLGMNSVEQELQTLLCCSGIAPDSSCVNQVYNAMMYQINACTCVKAPTMHASTEATYGLGTDTCYGHLKLSDTYTSVLSACANTAASQYALACVYATATAKAALGSTKGCALGTASAGTATTAARSDHVHPKPTRSELGLGTAADCAATAFRSCTWTPTCVACAGANGSGTTFGTAATFNKRAAATGVTYVEYSGANGCCLLAGDFLAYWNGAYANTGASNLRYYCGGAFGTAAACSASCFRPSTWTPSSVDCANYGKNGNTYSAFGSNAFNSNSYLLTTGCAADSAKLGGTAASSYVKICSGSFGSATWWANPTTKQGGVNIPIGTTCANAFSAICCAVNNSLGTYIHSTSSTTTLAMGVTGCFWPGKEAIGMYWNTDACIKVHDNTNSAWCFKSGTGVLSNSYATIIKW